MESAGLRYLCVLLWVIDIITLCVVGFLAYAEGVRSPLVRKPLIAFVFFAILSAFVTVYWRMIEAKGELELESPSRRFL